MGFNHDRQSDTIARVKSVVSIGITPASCVKPVINRNAYLSPKGERVRNPKRSIEKDAKIEVD